MKETFQITKISHFFYLEEVATYTIFSEILSYLKEKKSAKAIVFVINFDFITEEHFRRSLKEN